MRCIECDAADVSERCERTARGYRRFQCRACGKQFNERSGGILNRALYLSDVIALVIFWRLRYKLSLRPAKWRSFRDVVGIFGCRFGGTASAEGDSGHRLIRRGHSCQLLVNPDERTVNPHDFMRQCVPLQTSRKPTLHDPPSSKHFRRSGSPWHGTASYLAVEL